MISLNIIQGAEIHSDKGYEIGTLEQQQAFARKRNMKTISEQETQVFLEMAEAIKALNQQLDDANRNLRIATERVAQLESQVFGGPTK